tara:strand:- start:3481 stop:3825 length:345 start_codon:yes stop_codon:yes gene_type:complete
MISLEEIYKYKNQGQKIEVVLNHDVRTIYIYANNSIVAEQKFATLGQAKQVAGYLQLEEVCLIRTMRSFLRVDGKKKGYKGNVGRRKKGTGYVDPDSLLANATGLKLNNKGEVI